jgi:hypothetical protein
MGRGEANRPQAGRHPQAATGHPGSQRRKRTGKRLLMVAPTAPGKKYTRWRSIGKCKSAA